MTRPLKQNSVTGQALERTAKNNNWESSDSAHDVG